ncbi:DUF1513 domain-containing protein [Tabrizicola sp. BL-A-41-H6]|uniref:DUF1513 domain-containing protein n=1 Tax=Tabrizicola sp. BL-A-41-H6 TaxID=3421107 RepID=UPI003D676AE7
MTSRRGFLAGLAALAMPLPSWADAGSPDLLAAAKVSDGYQLYGLSAAGQTIFALPLPARGHAAAAHPTRPLAVAFARRPGTFAVVIDCATGAETHRLTPPEGRQFNGHGAFSAGGETLFTSEVVAATSEGRIGIWRSVDFTRIGEFSSGGIGPHDLKRLADGSLIVANGGIRTDPTDRTKLNVPDMRPALAHLSADGTLLATGVLPDALHQNSIRHLALSADGSVAFAVQWEGDPAITVPLLGYWTPGQTPRLAATPEAELARMKGYAGSIAMLADGTTAITSPRGGVVLIHAADGTHLASHTRADICGVSAHASGFIATDGGGALWACDQAGLTLLAQGGPAWDNHLVAVSV